MVEDQGQGHPGEADNLPANAVAVIDDMYPMFQYGSCQHALRRNPFGATKQIHRHLSFRLLAMPSSEWCSTAGVHRG